MGVLDAVGRFERRIGTDRVGGFDWVGEPTDPTLTDFWEQLDPEVKDWVQRAAFFGWRAEDPELAALAADLLPAVERYWHGQSRWLLWVPAFAGLPSVVMSVFNDSATWWSIAVLLVVSALMWVAAASWMRRRRARELQRVRTAALANRAVAAGLDRPDRE